MKVSTTIRKLDLSAEGEKDPNGGIWVLDSVSRIYCSFFTYLVNEMYTQKFKGVEFMMRLR
jgi:hypothetical protein